MNWYLKVVRDNYANFNGRARRQEYWMFAFINLIVIVSLIIIDIILFDSGMWIISSLYFLAIIIPGIAVAVRRLHDTSRSGWWVLLALIPIVGTLILLVFMCIDSTSGQNQYGPNPKHVGNSPHSIRA